jgi:hypothetical protein
MAKSQRVHGYDAKGHVAYLWNRQSFLWGFAFQLLDISATGTVAEKIRIRGKKIPDPNFFFSIPDPGSASKNLSILTPKIFLSSRKYDSGCLSRIRILNFYPSRIQGSKRHRIPNLDPQHWLLDFSIAKHQYNALPSSDIIKAVNREDKRTRRVRDRDRDI